MSESKSKATYVLVGLVVFFFIALMVFATVTMNSFQQFSSDVEMSESKGRIGVIEIEGVIMDAKDTVELLQEAEEDKTIDAIILRINSPGGAVGPTQEIYEEIRRIDGSKTGKPIFASFGAIAASGGYYVGAATRKIWASPGTLTGSIGVIMELVDLSKLYEFAKVTPQTVKAGKYKDAGNPARPMTEEEKTLMNTMLAGVHQQFISDIEKVRGNRIQGDIHEHAQGQIFSGEAAQKIGLVDSLGSLWTAGREIQKSLKIKGEFGLKYLKKKKKKGFFELISSLEESVSKLDWRSAIHGNYSLLMFK